MDDYDYEYGKKYSQNPFKTGEIKQDPRIRVEKIKDFNNLRNQATFTRSTTSNTRSNNEVKHVYGKGFVMIMNSY